MNQALILTSSAFFSLFAGFIPPLIWLWFWLKEDPHPEPKWTLIITFIAGMLAVPIALIGEILAVELSASFGLGTGGLTLSLLFVWAAIEEYTKYKAADVFALKQKGFDEPIDAPIYLITAALGFAAFENGIFLFRAFIEDPAMGIITSQLRFLGATMLHVTASGIVGISIAYSFFHRSSRTRNVIGGLFTATVLHALFNFFILEQGDGSALKVFLGLWAVAILFIVILEKVKRIRP